MISRRNEKFVSLFRCYQDFPKLKPIDAHVSTRQLLHAAQSQARPTDANYIHSNTSQPNTHPQVQQTSSNANTQPNDYVETSNEASTLHSEDLAGKSLQKQASFFSQSHVQTSTTVRTESSSVSENQSQDSSVRNEAHTSETSSNINATASAKSLGSLQTFFKSDSVSNSNSQANVLNSSHVQLPNNLNSFVSKSSLLSTTHALAKQGDENLNLENKNVVKASENLTQQSAAHTADVIGQNLHLPSSSLLGNFSPLLNNFRAPTLNTLNTNSVLTSNVFQTSNLSFLKNLVLFPGLSLLAPQMMHAELGQGLAFYNNAQGHSNLIPFQPSSNLMASLMLQFPEHASLFYSVLIGQIAALLTQRRREEKERARRKRLNKFGEVIRTEATPAIDVDVHEGQKDIIEEFETWVRINEKKTFRFWE